MAEKARPAIVIIGAGSSGRGQLGEVAYAAGWDITFIERDRSLVELLKSAGRYTVGLAGEQVRNIEISGFRVFHTSDTDSCAAAIAEADIVATAVLPTNLESTVPTVAAGLKMRQERGIKKPLNVICCENMERSSTTLREYLMRNVPDLDWDWIDAYVGFPDSMIARAVPVARDNPLYLLAETTQEWTVDATSIKRPMPIMEGMTLIENQNAALERKLYIKNTGHMAIGVLGYLKGYVLMDEAARDPEIFSLVDEATRESALAVVAKHGFDPNSIEDYRASFLEAMKSPFLPDETLRVVREPIRKLSREERLIGPAMLCCDLGKRPESLARVIASTFRLQIPGDIQSCELHERLARDGLEKTVQSICGVPEGHLLARLISDAWQSF